MRDTTSTGMATRHLYPSPLPTMQQPLEYWSSSITHDDIHDCYKCNICTSVSVAGELNRAMMLLHVSTFLLSLCQSEVQIIWYRSHFFIFIVNKDVKVRFLKRFALLWFSSSRAFPYKSNNFISKTKFVFVFVPIFMIWNMPCNNQPLIFHHTCISVLRI